MIRGLDLFREHFVDYKNAFVLIGGVACHEWLSTQGLPFRATKDMDMVLIVEALGPGFAKRFWEFIEAGKYESRFRSEDGRQLYRFAKPEDKRYPAMIEIFSRNPVGVDLAEGQHIVPIKLDQDSASLSAILLNDDYYSLVREQHNEEKNLPFANPAALIPLKARAYLDLAERAAKGEPVKSEDIAKHRTDVFRIAATLPGGAGPAIPGAVQEDLRKFLAAFPFENKEEWQAIGDGLKTTFGSRKLNPESLIEAIRVYFKL
jgi:hypothetical protein